MTIIEIKPHRWGWKVFQAPGVEPVFAEKRQAISYAEGRAWFRHESKAVIAVICVYDESGNVIETHEHAGDFKEW